MNNKVVLQTEGLITLVTTIYLYSYYEFSWWLFLALILVPDIGMLGYAINEKIGASVYNFFHTYVISISVFAIGLYTNQDWILALGIVWTAHIAMDRTIGYGLKYTQAGFKTTHLTRV
ncbi:DUF4260 domain-containing protein [Bacillus bingmayongensis]|uniref:DUF4260 domain-containing protein n=1 Tax=Bacillus bingmayongensis TaxID=1150157 RepID=UPI0002D5ED59|nr:DUF4260 domain-containing protein [Bacillus bingmayongensis]MBY0595870.1 DUF4260 domain-containing protein [Bacillus bingmayongensis]